MVTAKRAEADPLLRLRGVWQETLERRACGWFCGPVAPGPPTNDIFHGI